MGWREGSGAELGQSKTFTTEDTGDTEEYESQRNFLVFLRSLRAVLGDLGG